MIECNKKFCYLPKILKNYPKFKNFVSIVYPQLYALPYSLAEMYYHCQTVLDLRFNELACLYTFDTINQIFKYIIEDINDYKRINLKEAFENEIFHATISTDSGTNEV